jgi:hypothetical protein
MTEIDYIITPKTKSHAKDMAKIHDKLKKASSLKVFTDIIENEAKNLMIVDPEWIEECLKKEKIIESEKYQIRAPLEKAEKK